MEESGNLFSGLVLILLMPPSAVSLFSLFAFYLVFSSFLPDASAYSFSFQTSVPVVCSGIIITAESPFLFCSYDTFMIPLGWGISPPIFWMSPRWGSILTFEKPGASLSMPKMVRKNSMFGLAPQAWQRRRSHPMWSAPCVCSHATCRATADSGRPVLPLSWLGAHRT